MKQESVVSETQALRVRTITFGTTIHDLHKSAELEYAVAGLKRARARFNDVGYEVQTLRIALPPVLAGMSPQMRREILPTLRQMDALLVEHGVILSLGPLLVADDDDAELADWCGELVCSTRSMSFSVVIASSEYGVHERAARTSARIMRTLSTALPGGLANFRFAAAANIPAGTPFFPVAWHEGNDSVAIGLEAADLVSDALSGSPSMRTAEKLLKEKFDLALRPIEKIGTQIAHGEARTWTGIDASPAPGIDRSIAAGIEKLTNMPFGSASTLHACGTITAALKSLDVKTCGYSGLMLPVLEDPLLAQRASEQRFGIRDLLLYSSVCGTGLDVVPLPGDTPLETLTGLIVDVAALSTRLRKPLSVRLLLVPEKNAGDLATFDDPILTSCTVMKID
jgi:hypothetical protein